MINFTNLNLQFSVVLTLVIIIFSIAIDLIFGELPAKIHPVVVIGNIIDHLSSVFINIKNKSSGVFLTLLTIAISDSIAIFVLLFSTINLYLFIFISIIFVSSLYSINLLLSSANQIKRDLDENLGKAQKSMSYLVSRKTEDLNETMIVSAAIETLSENITDSVVSSVFYYCAFGVLTLTFVLFLNFNSSSVVVIVSIVGLLNYRIINTLDAMVGYKNEKFSLIGWFPAILDDILNFIPSRFSGMVIVISSFFLKLNWKNSYYMLRRDSRNCPSPNSGFTMAATAGALDIQLIKKNVYTLGESNKDLKKEDIEIAIKLSKISIFLSILILILVFYLISQLFIYLYI